MSVIILKLYFKIFMKLSTLLNFLLLANFQNFFDQNFYESQIKKFFDLIIFYLCQHI